MGSGRRRNTRDNLVYAAEAAAVGVEETNLEAAVAATSEVAEEAVVDVVEAGPTVRQLLLEPSNHVELPSKKRP